MSTISHKNLTGTQLHEPKGIAAAAVDKVYVSDGAGSGAWQKLTANQLTTTGNPFGAQLFHVRDEKTVGSNGDSYSSGAFRTIILNTTKTNEITSASLASNQISLPAGTYWLDAEFLTFVRDSGGRAKARLRNITDTSTLVYGMSPYLTQDATSGTNRESDATSAIPHTLRGRFTLGGTKTIELQVQPIVTGSVVAANKTEPEVYADVLIWKIA